MLKDLLRQAQQDVKIYKDLLQQEKEKNKELEKDINTTMLESSQEIVKLAREYEESYISKDIIKDKIKELEKAYEDSKDENGESQYWYPNYAIDILEELLEEE